MPTVVMCELLLGLITQSGRLNRFSGLARTYAGANSESTTLIVPAAVNRRRKTCEDVACAGAARNGHMQIENWITGEGSL